MKKKESPSCYSTVVTTDYVDDDEVEVINPRGVVDFLLLFENL
jgi:hypothetical protein